MNRTILPLIFSLSCAALAIGDPASSKQGKQDLSPSDRVDRFLGQGYRQHEIQANPIASDEVFLRRAYLDIIGRLPSKDEALAFLDDNQKNKRAKLVDSLMESEGFNSHFFNYWAELLRARSQLAGNGNSQAAGFTYQDWIREALASNMPYDEMVRELLTASGTTWENGAVGYYIRDYGMNLDNLAMTSQLFLGTQIVCAQCHDHPFDEWTQMDYYQMSAFTYGMVTSNQSPNAREAIQLYRKNNKDSDDVRDLSRAFSEILKPVRFNNVFAVDRNLRLPHDYQYSDARPKAVVDPAVPWGSSKTVKKGEMPIHAFADWIASPRNERFNTVIANRLWKRVMGYGLIEPVDDFKQSTQASNPALMDYLERLIVDLDYDMKAFLRTLYQTKTYQRESSAEEIALGAPYYFPGPVLRRMSAEQIWDSFAGMIVGDIDAPNEAMSLRRDRTLTRVRWTAEGVYDLTPEEMLEVGLEIKAVQQRLANELQSSQEKLAEARESGDVDQIRAAVQEAGKIRRQLDEEIAEKVFKRGIQKKKEVLLASNASKDSDPFWAELEQVLQVEPALVDGRGVQETGKRDVGYGGSNYIEDLVDAVLEPKRLAWQEFHDTRRDREIEELGLKTKKDMADYKAFDRTRRSLARASYMILPAPNGHFLREFGQSDLELIENSNDEASITQALALMNGREFNLIASRFSVLSQDLRDDENAVERLETVFLTTLSRFPTPQERQMLLPIIQEQGMAGAYKVLWTLFNTRQFLFVQ